MSVVLSHLYAILDPAQTRGRPVQSVLDGLLAAGVKLIQYRDKNASSRELFERSSQLVPAVRSAHGIFIVNDRADVSLAVDAAGVHLGQDDLPAELARLVLKPEKIIGCSTHNLEQVRAAELTSADYIAFGPIFATRSKDQPDPLVGLDGLRQARAATRKPLVAIGGITAETAPAVIEAGADSVAVISDLIGATNIETRAREYLRQLA